MAEKPVSESDLLGLEQAVLGKELEKLDLGVTTKGLPDELIMDILSRLPAADLWPLRCVCKPWLRLIARNPKFAKSIYDKSLQLKSNSSIIARSKGKCDFYLVNDYTECNKSIKLELPFLTDCESISVHGICNGMLCVSHLARNEVYIWNPLTKDYVTIPYPTTSPRSSDNHVTTLFAFGFPQSANEYKVIKLVSDMYWGDLDWNTQISSYTLGNGIDSAWKTVAKDLLYGVTFTGLPSPHVDGVVHWLARRDGEMPVSTILAFDLKEELLYEIDPPINLRAYGFRSDLLCVQELGGLLCLFNANNKVGVDVWSVKINGGSYSWTKQFTIGKSEIIGDFSVLIPLGVAPPSGDVILVKNPMGLITYNSDTKSVNDLKEFGFPIANAHAYFGSIISPRAISGAGNVGKETMLSENIKGNRWMTDREMHCQTEWQQLPLDEIKVETSPRSKIMC